MGGHTLRGGICPTAAHASGGGRLSNLWYVAKDVPKLLIDFVQQLKNPVKTIIRNILFSICLGNIWIIIIKFLL